MFFKQQLAIDIGSYKTVIYIKNKGVALRDYSVVAIDNTSSELVSCGKKALELAQSDPQNIQLIHPIQNGAISQLKPARLMVSEFIKQALQKKIYRPELAVTVPSTINNIERKALLDTFNKIGIGKIVVVESTFAAALGSRLTVSEPVGKMIVDIGAGTCDIGVVSFNEVVLENGTKRASYSIDQAIRSFVRQEYNLIIDHKTAQKLKTELGLALYTKADDYDYLEVSGRNITTNAPITAKVKAKVVYEAVNSVLVEIIGTIKSTLEDTPAELVSDIMDRGIYLAGAGSQLKRLSERINQDLGVRSHIVQRPADCVAIGAGRLLEDMSQRRGLAYYH